MAGGTRIFLSARQLSQGRILPAGTYRLFVVTSGPVTVRWTLPTPRPDVTVATASTVDAPSQVRVATQAAPAGVVAAQGHHRTAAVAQVWEFAWMHGTRLGPVHNLSYCLYRGDDAAAQTTEGLPAPVCPGFSGNFGPAEAIGIPPQNGPLDGLVYGGMTPVDATQRVNTTFLPDVGSKFTVSVSGVVDYSSTFQLWLPLT
jgi:hypothetical protein